MTDDETPLQPMEEPPADQEVVVLTGLSGGGKTAAAKLFEDLGYVVVDNLPGELLRDLADLIATEPVRYARTAIVLDVRTGDVPLAFGAMRGALEGRGIRPVIIFLDWRLRDGQRLAIRLHKADVLPCRSGLGPRIRPPHDDVGSRADQQIREAV